jgi:hypothetical protein
LLSLVVNPPSTITSRSVSSSARSSSAVWGSSVFSAGFPISLTGGRMNPRAPRFVFAVISHS